MNLHKGFKQLAWAISIVGVLFMFPRIWDGRLGLGYAIYWFLLVWAIYFLSKWVVNGFRDTDSEQKD